MAFFKKTVLLISLILTLLLFFHASHFPEWTKGRLQHLGSTFLEGRKPYELLCFDEIWRKCDSVCHHSRTRQYRRATLSSPAGDISIFIHDLKNDGYVSGNIALFGIWEQRNMNIVWAILNKFKQAVFLDIGSHIGEFTLMAAKMGHRVVAIDALGTNLGRLCRSLEVGKFNSSITIINNAVSNKKGRVRMIKNYVNFGGSYAVEDDVNEPLMANTTIVKAMTLNDLLPFVTFRQVVMKIDVEGYEDKVINGAHEFFKRNNVLYVLMEWTSHRRKSVSNSSLVRFLVSYSMVPFDAKRGRRLNVTDYTRWSDDVIWRNEREKT